jgi:hypothetical protein
MLYLDSDRRPWDPKAGKGVIMKRIARLLAAAVFLVLPLALSAAGGAAKSSGQWGLLFDAKNLLLLSGFEDGYQAGAGVKYWVQPAFAARAIVGLQSNTPQNSTITTTSMGLGLAGEWHPARADVSPYLGPLAGFRMLAVTGATTRADFYVGGLFGAEVKVLSSVSLFAEYDLIASWDINGFSLDFGMDGAGGGKALLGLIVYF